MLITGLHINDSPVTYFCDSSAYIRQVLCSSSDFKGDSLITNAQVIDVDFKNCAALSQCDYLAIAAVAWASVLEQLGAGGVKLYTHWAMVLPQGVCTSWWSALANIGEEVTNFAGDAGLHTGDRHSQLSQQMPIICYTTC